MVKSQDKFWILSSIAFETGQESEGRQTKKLDFVTLLSF